METHALHLWDYLPLNLTAEEILNPMLVLQEFFSLDWLPCHLSALKMWRDSILADAYYLGGKGSPSSLTLMHR